MTSIQRRTRIADARLYLQTDARRREGDLAQFLDHVLGNGIDIVELHDPGLSAREAIELAEVFATAVVKHGALYAVTDRADIAWVARTDVLLLDQDDLPVPAARAIVGDDVIIGRATHAPHEVDMAATADDVDYFVVGPVWPGHPEPGLPLLAHAAGRAGDKPWFAAGGIDASTVEQAVAAGASRVLVARAVTQSDEPGAAVAAIARRLFG